MLGVPAEVIRWAYDVWPSFGGAFLLIAIVVGALLTPITVGVGRLKRIQAGLQPEADQIRARHGQDTAGAAKQVEELYDAHGAISLKGCLPPLLHLVVVVLLVLVVGGLSAGPGPRYVDPESALGQSLRASGGEMPWFGLDLAQSASGAVRAPGGWPGAIGYLVLPTLCAARLARASRRSSWAAEDVLVETKRFAVGFSWVFTLFLPAAAVLYLLAVSVFSGAVALVNRSGSPGNAFRKDLQRADQMEAAGQAAAAAVVRLEAVAALVRVGGAVRLTRHADTIRRVLVAAVAHRPSDALSVLAELTREAPRAAAAATSEVVTAWAASAEVTQFDDDLEVIAELLDARDRDLHRGLLDACRAAGGGLTPQVRQGLTGYLREYLDMSVDLAAGHAETAELDGGAVQLLHVALQRELTWEDLLCALADSAMARDATPEALARYRAAAEAGSDAARQRLAYQQVREGHRLLAAGDAAGAYRQLTEACRLHDDPEYAMLRAVAGMLSATADAGAARAHLESLEQLGTSSPDILFWRAVGHHLRGENQPAAELLRQFHERSRQPAPSPSTDTPQADPRPWGLREEGAVLLTVLDGDDGEAVGWARRLAGSRPEGWLSAGLADPWPLVAAVARRDPAFLADTMARVPGGAVVPPWARLAGARALLSRSVQRAGGGQTGLALRDVDKADRLAGSADGSAEGQRPEHAPARVALRKVATDLRGALTRDLSPDQEAYAALSKDGELYPWTAQAEDLWNQAQGHDPWRRHHLAVLCHARAYDLENEGSPEAHRYWRYALEHWVAVHADDGFWDGMRGHLAEHMGSDFDQAVVEAVRERLPRDLLEPHRDLIVAYRSSEPDRAREHVETLTSAPFAADADSVRAGLVREVMDRVPDAVATANYEGIRAELAVWLAIDPENAHLLHALLTVNRNASERSVSADDELEQIERSVSLTEKYLHLPMDAGRPRTAARVDDRLRQLRPALPARGALRTEIARHQFLRGFVAMRKAQRLSSNIHGGRARHCQEAVGHFSLARQIDSGLGTHPIYQQVDAAEGMVEMLWGICLRQGGSDTAGAAQHFRRAVALTPDSFEPYLLLGQVLVGAGPARRDEARWAVAQAERRLAQATDPAARSALVALKQALYY